MSLQFCGKQIKSNTMKKSFLYTALAMLFIASACSSDDDTVANPVNDTTTFRITVSNVINYLNTVVFNTPDGATDPGPVTGVNGSYSIQFKAVPGSRLSFATMSAATNDWFFAPVASGVTLFDASGVATTGDITSEIYLWDAGTEEEDPATIATVPGGDTAGDPDDDNTVRIQERDVTPYLRAELSYDSNTRYFTLTLTNLMGAMGATPIILTPGLVVIHAQDDALFTEGEPDRGVGLDRIAEAGVPMDLYDWFNAEGSDGAPLRLSSSLTPFAPGLVYAFPGSESDPFFTQGSAVTAGSGLEELAEDGGNQPAADYLSGLGYPAAVSDQTAPIFPGEDFIFTLEVPAGYNLGFATMFIQSNDWFMSFNNDGVPLFNTDGSAFSGTGESDEAYLFDAGTEVDEAVGFGANQAPRQAGPNSGAPDSDTSIRRVGEIEDEQFGKGMITSAAGVIYLEDPRGGYNLIRVDIQPQ